MSTMVKLVEFHEDDFISDYEKTKVLEAAREFYKCSSKMAFKDEFWTHAVRINFLNSNTAKWDDVNYIVNRYRELLKTISDDEIDLTDAILSTYEDGNIEYRMDTV